MSNISRRIQQAFQLAKNLDAAPKGDRKASLYATVGVFVRGQVRTAAFRLGLDIKEDRRWFDSDFIFTGREADISKLQDMFVEYNKE